MTIPHVLLAAFCFAGGQDEDTAQVKKRILDKVRAKLEADRGSILKRVEKIVDEELGKEPSAAPAALPPDIAKKIKDVERKLRALDDQKETLAAEIARLKREAEDEPIKKEAKEQGPNDPEEAQEMFAQALGRHEKEKNFAESIRLFKKVYYQFPNVPVGVASAYNVACGYALMGKKEEALDWLDVAVRHGYNNIEHLREDTDLECLRGEKRYKKLLTDK